MTGFQLNANAKKQDIINQYKRLLDTHTKAVRENAEAQKKLTELERRTAENAADLAGTATVSSVIENLGKLRGQVGATLNDLTDKMGGEAEKLEALGRSVKTQERRLKELYDIEATADALDKLVTAYDERHAEAESDFESLLEELNSKLENRKNEAESELAEEQENLSSAIEDQRLKWRDERTKVKQENDEYEAETAKSRKREEAEYVYNRDRERKLEQDEYDERKKGLEKELVTKREATEKELTIREKTVTEKETRLSQLEAEVAGFPERLSKEVSKARNEAAKEVQDKAFHDASLVDVERSWEKRNLEQRIAHLQDLVTERDEKIDKLTKEITVAGAQVNEVAKKAIEGASLNQAYQSVNKIALEQARKSDPGSTEH